MTDNDWKEFAALVVASDEMLGLKSRSVTSIRLMFQVLGGYRLDDVRRAVEAHIRKSPYYVKPADIISFLDGTANERSGVAWRTFLRAVYERGHTDSVRFPDPAFHYAIEQLGGWMHVCAVYSELEERELHFRAKEWRQLYEVGERVASWIYEPGKMRVQPYFVGFFEADNRAKGYISFIPPVIEVSTGRHVCQEELSAGYESQVTSGRFTTKKLKG